MVALEGRKVIPPTPIQTEKYIKPTHPKSPAYIGNGDAAFVVKEEVKEVKEKEKTEKKEKKKKRKRSESTGGETNKDENQSEVKKKKKKKSKE